MPGTEYIVFGLPLIGEAEIQEVVECLRSGWIGTGPRTARFERNFAEYKRVSPPQVAAVNSCTAALHISLLAAGLPPDSEVITTPLTFCASVNAIIHAGLRPVLADVDPETQCIAPGAIEAAITERTTAILPVHFAGRACDMNSIMRTAQAHDLVVIEDCAHAIETQYEGRTAGTFGDFGCFSFYATKNITTAEGGMILGRSEELVSRAKVLALHGMNKDAWKRYSDDGFKHYQVTECGFKYNMPDLQAALGIHQLARVEENWQRRLQIWSYYMAEFRDLPLQLPAGFTPNSRHGLHLFTVGVSPQHCRLSRDQFLASMHLKGIGTGVHYLSVPEHPYYQHTFGWNPEHWPSAHRIGRETASIPLSASLTDAEVERVAAAVRTVILE